MIRSDRARSRLPALLAIVALVLAACQRPGPGVDGEPGEWATVQGPWTSVGGMAIGADGVLRVSDPAGHRIWSVQPDGSIALLAGDGTEGDGGDGGPAVDAQLGRPTRLALDAAGRLYVTDPGRARVRRIDRQGRIETVLGTGVPGSAGDGGPAAIAQVVRPWGIVVHPDGDVLVSDLGAGTIRRIATDGTVSTWLGPDEDAPPSDGPGYWPTELALGRDDSIVYTPNTWPCEPLSCPPVGMRWWPSHGIDAPWFPTVGPAVGEGDPAPVPVAPGTPLPTVPVPPDLVELAAARSSMTVGGVQARVWTADPGPGTLARLNHSDGCALETVAGQGSPGSPDGTPVVGSDLAEDPTALTRRPSGDLYVAVGAEVRVVPGLDPDPDGFLVIGCAVSGA